MSARLVVLGLASSVCAFGYNYAYDYSGAVTSSSMTQNGTVAAWTPAAQFSPGGSLIWGPAINGAVPNDYEVNTTIALAPGGGTYIEYFRASSNALASPSGCAGSYISAEIGIAATYSSGGATALLRVNQCSSGTWSNISGVFVPVLNGSTFRVVVFGSNLWVFVDDQAYLFATIPTTTGQPGIGGYGMVTGAGFTNLSIGHHDTVAPNPVDGTTIRSSILPNQVSLAWKGADDTDCDYTAPTNCGQGIGTAMYDVARYDGTTWTFLALIGGPSIVDSGVSPGTSYTYIIDARDFHGNENSYISFAVTTPPANAVDPRRVGVFTTGSYWGGGGEQIDMLSGNLNFSLPLVTAKGRPGWSVPVGLSYNSQTWRQDGGYNWELGADVGYGYGWSLQIGSVTPYYDSWLSGVGHYVYTDGTGAQYTLTQIGTSNVWTSAQGIYVWFDANTSTLHFKNGLFWLMGCVSSGAEQDAGTMYPTIIEDTGGNQVIVTYAGTPSLPGSPVNTSNRISTIDDSTNGGVASYTFFYSPSWHLASIFGPRGGTAQYFSYAAGPLKPPASFGGATDPRFASTTTTRLATLAEPVAGSYAFTYDSTGASELLQATFPWGGCLGWDFADGNYAGSRKLREVANRYMNASSSASVCGYGYETAYPLTHSDSWAVGGIPSVHADTTLADMSGNGAKKWTFNSSGGTSAWQMGAVAEFDQMPTATSTSKLTSDTYTWSQTVPISGSGPVALANPYISKKVSVKDPATGSAASAETDQQVDQYGNTTQTTVYPWNTTGIPVATYNSTYVTTSGYLTNYVLGLVQSSSVTPGGGSLITLTSNVYDNYTGISCTGGGTGVPTYLLDYGAVATPSYGGYLVSTTTLPGTSLAKTSTQCYWYGVSYSSTAPSGLTTSSTLVSSTNYAVPATITAPGPGSGLTSTAAYDPWLSLASTTGPNGQTMSLTYDGYGRPATATSPYGAVTTYGYTGTGVVPVQQTSSGPSGFSRTTLDGFGRAVLAESGTSSTAIQSKVSTIYAPCACSPLGKISQVSQPYAPGGGAVWTVYTYDGIGRPLTVRQPDGVSTSTYSYAGNNSTLTDPAGNWKTFTSDVVGNLTTVLEPNPAGGTFTTSYTYDWMNHLVGSSMTRGATTQTRTFVYNNAGQLLSATNPENGYVSYSYNSDMTLAQKTDFKGQVTVYSYDSSKRPTETQIYPSGLGGSEDLCQRVTYQYDSGTNGLGRLTSRQYGVPYSGWSTSYLPVSGVCSGAPAGYAYQDSYQYDVPGQVTGKTFTLVTNNSVGSPVNAQLTAGYSYDWAGRLSTATYPVTGVTTAPTYTYGYDGMGRAVSMSDNLTTSYSGTGVPWVQNGQYDAAGHMTSMTVFSGTTVSVNPASSGGEVVQTMGYNTSGQMTSMNWAYPPPYTYLYNQTLQYSYSATANNGQITQMTDFSGETANYAYDSLKRLTGATAASGGSTTWTQYFGYDGFGNMTSKSTNGGLNSAPAVNTATNQLTSSYDLNGNMLAGYGLNLTYDEMDRVASASPTSSGTEYYAYAPDNKRIYRWNPTPPSPMEEWTFYGAMGERIGTFGLYVGGGGTFDYFYPSSMNVWFGGKLITKMTSSGSLTSVVRDRLGSDRETGARYYPYGDEITSTGNGSEKFATYVRDSFSGMDYADQRYYVAAYGRFNTADPAKSSASPGNPTSWNRYLYSLDDPINRNDAKGLCSVDEAGNYWDDDPWWATWLYDGPCSPGGGNGFTGGGGGGIAGPDPCSLIYQTLVGGTVTCTIAPIIVVSAPIVVSTPAPQCDAELFTRPVSPGGLFSLGKYGTHSYLEVWDSSGETTLEGGPANDSLLNPGLLTAFNTPNGVHYIGPTGDNPGSDSHQGAYVAPCSSVDAAIADDKAFVSTLTYNGIFGPNSNSFMNWLLGVSGLTYLFPTPPAGSVGWTDPVVQSGPIVPVTAPGPGTGGFPRQPRRNPR